MKYTIVKIFWFFGYPVKRLYWFLFRPKTRGVKCIVEDNGKILMVKINYAHHKWTFPGGKVEKSESFLEAAIRETKEETGIEVKNIKYAGFYKTEREYKRDTVEIYVASTDNKETRVVNLAEIEKVEWFERLNIPKDISPACGQILKIYDEYKSKTN